MRKLLMLAGLATVCACDGQPQGSPSGTTEGAMGVATQNLGTRAASSKLPAMVPLPKDPAEVDRMILAGYTPHGKHLHAPGVKECPLSQGNEAVM